MKWGMLDEQWEKVGSKNVEIFTSKFPPLRKAAAGSLPCLPRLPQKIS